MSKAQMKTSKVTDLISEHLEHLPDNMQVQVLDFVKYLEAETERKESLQISLSNAMKDMGADEVEYSLNDIKEHF